MTAEAFGELPKLFQQLQKVGESSDEVLYNLIEDISKICLEGVKSENAGEAVCDSNLK